MNLEQILSLEGITDYYIWWYGSSIADDYLNDDGFLQEVINVQKGKPSGENRLYIVMSGENGTTCRYRFSVKLKATENKDFYKWERVNTGLDAYAGRMIFRREKGFSFYNSPETGKEFVLEEIRNKEKNRKVSPFTDYETTELTFEELCETVTNRYSDYYNALSCVNGVYMIIDGNTGKQYIGSACGENGIWGRWSTYANTCHGGNLELEKLYTAKGKAYFVKFKYIILRVLSMNISEKEIVSIENYYKNRFLTREFGLNEN